MIQQLVQCLLDRESESNLYQRGSKARNENESSLQGNYFAISKHPERKYCTEMLGIRKQVTFEKSAINLSVNNTLAVSHPQKVLVYYNYLDDIFILLFLPFY